MDGIIKGQLWIRNRFLYKSSKIYIASFGRLLAGIGVYIKSVAIYSQFTKASG